MLQLLAPERVAIVSTEAARYVEDSVEVSANLDPVMEDSKEVQSATQDHALQFITITPEVLTHILHLACKY